MLFRLTIIETPIICTLLNYTDSHLYTLMNYLDTHPNSKLLTETPIFFQNQIYEDTHVCNLKYNQEHPPYSDKHKDGCLDKRMSK